MLVISQQEGEELWIGEDIRIAIRRVRGGWVRLAIDAPRHIPVRRVGRAEEEATVAPAEEPAERG